MSKYVGILAAALVCIGAGAGRAQRGPEGAPPQLLANLGSHHYAITTRMPRAQRYFDQGLRLTYGFNHAEAIRAFREAARLDPGCAMCYWGVALALGPNINLPMSVDAERAAAAAVDTARTLAAGASPEERALIEALGTRYAPGGAASRAALDTAYAGAMREVVRRYPRDGDAATLFAEALLDLSPWQWWSADGQPTSATVEAIATLETVLRRYPDNPGACHYYIHAIEESPTPGRALPCARRLAALMPGAGHLVHMPGHVYFRLGRYAEAVEANHRAVHSDEVYLEGRSPVGAYPLLYLTHNYHFLWAAATMLGESAEAIRAARAVAAHLPADALREYPELQAWAAAPYLALARFRRWDELLRESAPPADLRFLTGMWRYARGGALLATDRRAEAQAELDSVRAIAAGMPQDTMVGHSPGRALLTLAGDVLAGRLDARVGDLASAEGSLRRAVQLEDALGYGEPPPWDESVRLVLGGVLLAAGRPADAERAYREDLLRHPENGWALHGLAACLRSQHRAAEAASVERRFRRAWSHADFQIAENR